MKFLNLFEALKAGRALADAATWKNRQLLGTALATIAAFLVQLLPPQYNIFSASQIADVVNIIVLVAMLWNSVLTVATTEKIGLPSPSKDDKPASPLTGY